MDETSQEVAHQMIFDSKKTNGTYSVPVFESVLVLSNYRKDQH
jgi:hypothetical protein